MHRFGSVFNANPNAMASSCVYKQNDTSGKLYSLSIIPE